MTALAASPVSRSGRARVLVGQVVVMLAVYAANASLISVLLPSRVAQLDPEGKVATLAIVLAVASAANAVAQPLVGALSDRTRGPLGRRLPWMAGGALVGGVAVGSIGGTPSVILLAILWTIAQPALGALQVATDAYLVDAFAPERRGLAAGIVGIAVVIGSSAGAALSGSLLRDAPATSWILAAAVAIAVIVFAIVVRDTAAGAPALPRRRRLGATIRKLAAVLAAHPDYLRILLWRFGYSIAYGTVFAYLLYLLTDLVGVPEAHAGRLVGLATALGGAGALLGVFGGGWLSDRTARRRLFVLVGSGALAAGDVALLVAHTVPAALVTATLFGLGLGLSVSCGRALASQVLPDQARGAAAGLGLLNTAANVGQVVAPAVGALAIGIAGYPGALVASIVGAAVCVVAVAFVRTVR